MSRHELNIEEDLDLGKYIQMFTKRWKWFAASLIVCLSMAYGINGYIGDKFYTVSTILIKDNDQSSIGVNDLVQQLAGLRAKTNKNLETELGVLRSQYLARKALKGLDFGISYFVEGKIKNTELYQCSPFKLTLDTIHGNVENFPVYIEIIDSMHFSVSVPAAGEPTKTLGIGSWYVSEWFAFKLDKDSWFDVYHYPQKYFFIINSEDALVQQFQSILSVELDNEDASIIRLGMTSELVKKNINFLNELAQVYINDGMDEKNQVALSTINFIDNQLNRIVDSLQIAEGDLQLFRQNNKIIDLGKEGTSLFDKLEEFQNQRSLTDVRLKYYDYLLSYVSSNTDFKDVISPAIMGINDQLLNKLVSDLSAYNQEKKVLEYSVKTSNPQLDVISLRIKNTVESLIEVVRNIIQGTKIEQNDLNVKIAQIDRQIQKLPLTERDMIKIKRKFDLNDNIYNFLQQKRAEAGIASASNTSDSRILDLASESSSYSISIKKKLVLVVALFMGLCIPAAIIIISSLFNGQISAREDIEKATRVPIAAVISKNKYNSELIVHEKPQSRISENFRSLRVNIKFLMPDRDKAVICVTSALSGEGKTFCSCNLAVTISQTSKHVVIVGFDLRKPKLHQKFGMENEIGLSTYLAGENSLLDIIQSTQIPNLDIIAAGPVPPNPAELIDSSKTAALFTELRNSYDYVIIDTPPLAIVADSLLLMPYADLNLFVIRQNYSFKEVVTLVNSLREDKQIEIMGIVLNDENEMEGALSSRYGGGYYSDENISTRTWIFRKMMHRREKRGFHV